MTTSMSSSDLRSLANAMAAMTEVTRQTGVEIGGYGDCRVMLNDHVMRVVFVDDQYLVEIPDER